MQKISVLLVAGLLALAACGDDEEDTSASKKPAPGAADARSKTKEDTAAKDEDPAPARKGTTITLGDSEFGRMLFDSRKQAIYIFEKDRDRVTVCYDECAEAWPPVFTEGEPQAGPGVKQALLGSIKRRDGRQQVTYAGQPLYFYVDEGPGEVRCHNVNLNGGLWWVVGPDGKRRP